MKTCTIRESLQRAAADVLDHFIHVTQEQRAAVANADMDHLKELDSQLELIFGEKERTFGALWGAH